MKMRNLLLALWMLFALNAYAYGQNYRLEKSFKVRSARQAVAIDQTSFYTVCNREVNKYSLAGEWIAGWKESDMEKIKHLNSGIVIDGKLYCAHSNYPESPMASSIEVFDTRTMQHIESISLGIEIGSCTWLIPKEDGWYVFFAHYDNKGKEPEKDATWSQLIAYDKQWVRQRGWTLPKDLLAKTRPNSLSGAVMIDGKFYCTGHDEQEAYILTIPDRGMNLEWSGTINIPFKGQGIAVDEEGNLWGIDRKENLVLKATP